MLFEDEHNKFIDSRHGMIEYKHDNGIQKWKFYIPKCVDVGFILKDGMPCSVVVSYKKRPWMIPLSNPS